ncbi:MAG: RagB/SusD family nutrient uptake outer membrane protein, partial [Chitinophagaceae bacterium]
MKNIKLLLLVVLALNFAACKKFLDEKPITQVDETFVFSDVVNTRKAIAGVYSQLTGDQGYGIRLSLYFTVDNDETQGPSGNPTGDNDRRDISRYKATPSNAQIERPFNQLFKGIEFANNCIQGIPKSPVYTGGSEKEKKQMQRMLGEALTLRAQFYFEAIRNWGDLPEHFGSAAAQAQGDAFPKRVNRDIIYDKIIEDLKTAATLMPWRSEVSSIGDDIDERITKGTAKALRARIALFRAGYSLRNDTKLMQQGDDANKFYNIARTECKEIMDAGEHSLNPSFKSLWKEQVCAKVITDPNGELMFQVSGIGAGAKADTKLGYYNGPSVNSKGNRSVNILPTYFYQFDSSDLRRDVTCAPYSVLADGVSKTGLAATAIVDGKYRRDWITPAVPPTSDVQYFGLKWQIIRYSDVLLMFAEAENELNGPTAAAYDAINAVRRRGFGVNASTPGVDIPAGLGKLDFFKYLVKERSLEFGGEGIRKYDLIRWNLLEKALNESKQNLTALANSTNLVNPTYMAGYPTYVLDNKLPRNMFFKTNTKSDENTTQGIWMNSFYN